MYKIVRKSQQNIKAAVLFALCIAVILINAHAGCAQAAYSVLHRFDSSSTTNDGAMPVSSLTLGNDGNYYGTTQLGGSTSADTDMGLGTAFKMSPTGQVTVLHNFGDGSVPNDGEFPSASLTLGPDGNFYGTTLCSTDVTGAGDVFRMTPAGVVTILYEFSVSQSDGNCPAAPLAVGNDGNLYGTTMCGGSAGGGILFKMSLTGTESVLHNFGDGSVPSDGASPTNLIKLSNGAFLGITSVGGTAAAGTLYEFNLSGVYSVLHNFQDGSIANDGALPDGLVQGSDGGIYVTTLNGGVNGTNGGAVIKLSNTGNGAVLYSFDQSGDGFSEHPLTGLVQAGDGNFYGTTANIAYCLTPTGLLTVLHTFGGVASSDGFASQGPLYASSDGWLYGLTEGGGTADSLGVGSGTAYKVGQVDTVAEITKSVPTGLAPGTVTLPAGLNFFSSPYEYGTESLDSVFGYSGVTLALWSQPLDQYYLTPDPEASSLVFGNGYWVRLPQAVTLPSNGTTADTSTDFDIPLNAGWTSIGDPFMTAVPVSSLLFNHGTETYAQGTSGSSPLIGSTIWTYNQGTNSYVAATSMTPGGAYWISASSPTDVEIPHP